MGNKHNKSKSNNKTTLLHHDLMKFLEETFKQIPDNIFFKNDSESKAVFKGIAEEFIRINER